MKASRGFSLMEVLVVTVLLTMVLGALFPMVSEGLRNWDDITKQTELRNSANLIMHAIERDLLKARPSPDGASNGVIIDNNQLTIVTAWTKPASGSSIAAEPVQVIVYTIQREPENIARIYRYTGPPPTGHELGMQLGHSGLNFDESSFERSGNGRVLVKIFIAGPASGTKYMILSTFRYLYGF